MATANGVQNNLKDVFNRSDVEFIYQDEQCVAYMATRNIQSPEHFLVVPRVGIPLLSEASPEDKKIFGHLILVAKNLAIRKGLNRTGYHVLVDEDHRTRRFHALHIFGRTLLHMLWPIGPTYRL